MTRRQVDPLRRLDLEEWRTLEHVARCPSERADRVARATALLAVACGATYTEAAHAAGRRSGDAVAQLVARFNQEGLAALDRRHGGGPAVQYGPEQRQRILREFQRTPDREQDGTATWSLSSLQRALRQAPDGLPQVSTGTILQVLWEAGYSWQRTRTWCPTGTARRKRKKGIETVVDPATEQKRGPATRPIGWARPRAWRSGVRMKPVPTRRSRSRGSPGSSRGSRPASPMSISGAARPSC